MQEGSGQFNSPQERYQNAFGNLFLNINNLQTFYLTTSDLLSVGKDYVEKKIVKDSRAEVEEPEFQQLFGDNPLLKNETIIKFLASATAKRSIRLSKQIAGSATLVFAHAMLDGILSECCEISFLVNPSDWHPFVEEQKLKFSELQNAEKILHQKTNDFIIQLGRESIARKLDFLHKVCAPKWNGEKLITSWIKQCDLDEFDQIRHKAIHQQTFAEKISKVEEQIIFAHLVGTSALTLVGKAYGFLDKEKFTAKDILSKAFCEERADFPEIRDVVKSLIDANIEL